MYHSFSFDDFFPTYLTLYPNNYFKIKSNAIRESKISQIDVITQGFLCRLKLLSHSSKQWLSGEQKQMMVDFVFPGAISTFREKEAKESLFLHIITNSL